MRTATAGDTSRRRDVEFGRGAEHDLPAPARAALREDDRVERARGRARSAASAAVTLIAEPSLDTVAGWDITLEHLLAYSCIPLVDLCNKNGVHLWGVVTDIATQVNVRAVRSSRGVTR